MGWFGFGRTRAKAATAPVGPGASGREKFREFSGRRHVADAPYLLPKDDQEVARLDFQHYMLRYALRGNYVAPIENPLSILDVGCGTGRWAAEMASLFPRANVVGVDIVPPPTESGQAARPENWAFIEGNILQGLPFADRTFNFSHQRLLVFALPATRWQDAANELARVTQPGGWVEWLEGHVQLKQGGRAIARLNEFAALAGKGRGIDPTLVYRIADYLRGAGLVNIQSSQVDIPINTREGRLGQMGVTDYTAVISGLKGPLVAQQLTTPEEFDQTLAQARDEMDTLPVYATFPVAWGQRPR